MRPIGRSDPPAPAARPVLLADRKAASAVEYALLVALIATVAMTGILALGGSVGDLWAAAGSRMLSAFMGE